MKLYYSQNSPFARVARIVVRELALTGDVEEIKAANRQPDNPVLAHSAVGRVPTLVDGKMVITETHHVVDYLVQKAGTDPTPSSNSPDWNATIQEGQIVGFVDGIGCWVRENRREPETISDFLNQVEHDRSERCLAYLESEATKGELGAFPEFRFVALAAALDLMTFHQFHPAWQKHYPNLAHWFDAKRTRASMLETEPE